MDSKEERSRLFCGGETQFKQGQIISYLTEDQAQSN
jgi:hypothetical protein